MLVGGGDTLLAEIREQPAALRRLAAVSGEIGDAAAEAARRGVRHVRRRPGGQAASAGR